MNFSLAVSFNDAKTTSEPCKDGSYKDSSMKECQQCPTNTYSTGGAGLCTSCPQRSIANTNRTKCGEHLE